MTLTCPLCTGPLYPRLVKRTDEGWQHVQCPVESPADRERRARACLADLAEDVDWMVETGETIAGVMRRTGRDRKALQKALSRIGRGDLYRTLVAREQAAVGVERRVA